MNCTIIEWVKILATPFVTALLGVSLLHRIQIIKLEVSKRHEFNLKWADEFFIACKEFMQCIERNMALLHQLQFIENPNGDVGTRYQKEITIFMPKLAELEMRIK